MEGWMNEWIQIVYQLPRNTISTFLCRLNFSIKNVIRLVVLFFRSTGICIDPETTYVGFNNESRQLCIGRRGCVLAETA